MSDEKTPVETPLEEDFNEEEQLLLESHIKKNAQTEPTQFTLLYVLISCVTVGISLYPFAKILDLSVLDPINGVLYLTAFGATAYFLVESYQQMYETESLKGMSDANGKWIKELESRTQTRNDSIKDKSKVRNTKVPTSLRTAIEIFLAEGGKQNEWRDLSKQRKQHYSDIEAAEEVAFYSAQVAELRHFQYQKAMGYALLMSNLAFIVLSVIVSQLLLRNYDSRINLIVSTIGTGLATSLLAKTNEDSVKQKKN